MYDKGKGTGFNTPSVIKTTKFYVTIGECLPCFRHLIKNNTCVLCIEEGKTPHFPIRIARVWIFAILKGD
jgi:hypothetical protein